MRKVVIAINLRMLGKILQIPEGGEIVFAVQRVDAPDILEMYVKGVGPDFPEEGGAVLTKEALVVHDVHAYKIDWPAYTDPH